jgi:hypothetical protein
MFQTTTRMVIKYKPEDENSLIVHLAAYQLNSLKDRA